MLMIDPLVGFVVVLVVDMVAPAVGIRGVVALVVDLQVKMTLVGILAGVFEALVDENLRLCCLLCKLRHYH